MSPPDLMLFNGDWASYVEAIYDRYHADFVGTGVTVWGKPVQIRWVPTTKDKPYNFWHVVSEGQEEEERTPDLRRCERIGWIAWVIQCFDKGLDCVRWLLSERSTPRGRKVNLVLWAHELDYVVILEPRNDFALLVSAYPLGERRKQKLAKEHSAFVANPQPIPFWEKEAAA